MWCKSGNSDSTSRRNFPSPVSVLLTWLNPGLAAVAFMASLISKMADSSEEEGAGDPPPLHGGAADFEATTTGGGAAAAAEDPDEATATAAGAEAGEGEDDDEAAAAAILLGRDSLSPSLIVLGPWVPPGKGGRGLALPYPG